MTLAAALISSLITAVIFYRMDPPHKESQLILLLTLLGVTTALWFALLVEKSGPAGVTGFLTFFVCFVLCLFYISLVGMVDIAERESRAQHEPAA